MNLNVQVRTTQVSRYFINVEGEMRSIKINCTQVLLKFHEYDVPVLELSLSTTNRCTQTQLIIKNSCTQLKYLSTHCNQGRS